MLVANSFNGEKVTNALKSSHKAATSNVTTLPCLKTHASRQKLLSICYQEVYETSKNRITARVTQLITKIVSLFYTGRVAFVQEKDNKNEVI